MGKRLLEIIKKIPIIFKNYVEQNKLFVIFFVTNLINSVILRVLTVGNFLAIDPVLADAAILLLLGSLGYLFNNKKQYRYWLILSIFFTTVCVANSMYYTFYTSFASVSLLSTSVFIVAVSDAVVKNVIEISDFTYIWQPVLFIIVRRKMFNKKNKTKEIYLVKSKKKFGNTLLVGISMLILFLLTLTSTDLSRFYKQWNREFLVMKFGIYTYQFNDIVRSIEPKINSAFGQDKATKYVKEYYEGIQEDKKTNEYTNIFKGKDLIVIHAESIQSIAMDTKFNGNDVTPNLNKLASEGLNFRNFYSQVSVGTSSDAEFTLNTSLLPVSNGTVFVSYWNREYIGIPKLLRDQGYYAFSMHANNGSFWNRAVMHEQLGYQHFYTKQEYDIDEEIGLGLADKSFFRQSIEKIKDVKEKEKKPIYASLLMLSNHTPFDETEKYGYFPVTMEYQVTNLDGTISTIESPYMEDTRLGNYFKSVHYADSALGEFIEGMDKEGLLDNAVVVIYGDHDARLPRNNYVRLFNYDPYNDEVLDDEDPNYRPFDSYDYEVNRKVPFIIWSKDKKYQASIDKVMGMYDVLPTLGNMFGFESYYALGHDIFSIDNNVVVFPNGNFITDLVFYNSQKEEYKLLSDGPIGENYIKEYSDQATNMLKASNNLIMFDVIRRLREAEELQSTTKGKVDF